MNHPRNDQIQAVIVAKLKADATVLAQLSDTNEIRENEWQGTEFSYPNIRVRIISNKPLDTNCEVANVSLGIQVFSEDASSQQADRIAGIISNVLHDHPFSSSGLQIALRRTDLVPAIRSNARTWRSEVLMAGIVSG
jgi:hypothetical protein